MRNKSHPGPPDFELRLEHYSFFFHLFNVERYDTPVFTELATPYWSHFARTNQPAFLHRYRDVDLYYNDPFLAFTGLKKERMARERLSHFDKIIAPYYRTRYFYGMIQAIWQISYLPKRERLHATIRLFFPVRAAKGKEAWVLQTTQIGAFGKNEVPMFEVSTWQDLTQFTKERLMKCSVLSGNKEIFIDLEKPFGRDLKYSARELEILKLIDQGLQNKQIADKLKISWFTVSNHRKNIMNKTEGHSIPQAINFAKAKGLI